MDALGSLGLKGWTVYKGCGWLLLFIGIALLVACNGDDISSLPEAVGGLDSKNPANATFDAGTNGGWSVTGLWHVSTQRSSSPPYAMWYGQEGIGTFNTGGTNSGTLQNTVNLTGITQLVFNYYLDNECLENAGSPTCTADALKPQISTDGGATWSDLLPPPGELPETFPPGAWLPVSIDLSAYTNTMVQIRFSFDTVDSVYNDYEGAFVDNIFFIP